ncbi:MAG TPA: hypothetical protein VFL57_00470 [Bryobacteraceae bacterium]|nr:hypothetical protein [Bryobacteraceae bacterium]
MSAEARATWRTFQRAGADFNPRAFNFKHVGRGTPASSLPAADREQAVVVAGQLRSSNRAPAYLREFRATAAQPGHHHAAAVVTRIKAG